MQEFFAMGGYAIYVWPSFALFLATVFGGWGTAVIRHRRIKSQIQQLEQTQS